MDYHHHARLTVHGRELLSRSVVEGRLGLCAAAAEHKISRQTAGKWVRRYREGGMAGLSDRSSRPLRLRAVTCEERVRAVEHLRRQRRTGVEIAAATGLSRATVSRILTRLKLNKMRMLEPAEPAVRYEHPAPGDMLHIDIKKLARIVKAGHRITGDPRDETRGAGWEFLYVAVDDHSRLAYTAMYPNEKAASSIDFLHAAAAWFARFGIRTRGVLTDNGPCFHRQFGGLPGPQHPPPAHSPVSSANQWKSRALHPDRTPRMGLCTPLRELSTTPAPPSALDPPLQLASTTC